MCKLILWIGAIALIGILVGCNSSSPDESTTTNRVVSAPRRAVATSTTTRARAVLTPFVQTTPSVATTPTIVTSPTITPTPGPPTATLTPAPGEATLSAAQNVDQALMAFAQAAASGDSQSTLQAQRKLLDAANNAASIAEADQTSYGRSLQSALDAVQGAAAGDYDKLNDAHKDLVQ